MANEEQLDVSGPSCLGAGRVASKEQRIFSNGLLTGVCPACGERLTISRRGVLPPHPTKAPEAR
jgi:hypothetical protein